MYIMLVWIQLKIQEFIIHMPLYVFGANKNAILSFKKNLIHILLCFGKLFNFKYGFKTKFTVNTCSNQGK